ncbi:hypothetical protein MRX96_000911 [Rhipicephalus microplus]
MDGNEIASERVAIFSHDGEDNQPGIAYTAYLWGRMVEKGHVAGPGEAEDVLRNVDSYAACKGALSTKSMQKCDLTRGLQEQVTTHEGTYFSKRCVGKGPSEGQACISSKYLRKALLTRQSRLKRSVRRPVVSTSQKLRSARQKIRRLSSRSANLKGRAPQNAGGKCLETRRRTSCSD